MLELKEEKTSKMLVDALQSNFDSLKKSDKLSFLITGNDVSEVVLRYIPIGSSFDKAEEVLRNAGFSVSARPGIDPPGNRPDKHTVSADSYSILDAWPLGYKNRIAVVLEPREPGDYSRVEKLYALIIILTP